MAFHGAGAFFLLVDTYVMHRRTKNAIGGARVVAGARAGYPAELRITTGIFRSVRRW
jgi:hypothetical protein